MNIISRMLVGAAAATCLTGMALQSFALPTIGMPVNGPRLGLKTTAAACNPATATIDLDINNVRARMMTGGDMWWDRGTGTAKYEVPKGSGKNSLFAGSVWVGGYDDQNTLKVAGQTYRQTGNDYWPGPTQVDGSNVNSAPDKTICSDWDKFWKIDRTTLIDFQEKLKRNESVDDPVFETIRQWPATGNDEARGASGLPLNILTNPNYSKFGRNYAPYIEVDGTPGYNAKGGDYPDIAGDQFIWWVFNDQGNVKLQSQSVAIGMEVQASAFAYSSKDFLNDATFIQYKLINRGTLNLNQTYMATWTDADLGDGTDDYIGCDTARSLGIMYNGKSVDGTGKPTDYGSAVPMVGVDFFIGPKRVIYDKLVVDSFRRNGLKQILRKGNGQDAVEDTLGMTVFNYFNNGGGSIGDPGNALEMYRVMTGFNRQGGHLHNDQASCPSSTAYGPGPDINYVWPGNPDRAGDWSECQCGTTTGDRRFVHSSGPFRLEAGGVTNDIIIGACWVPNVGGCPNGSFTRIRAADDLIQDLFDNHFKTIEGPEAPRMVVREMDRKLVFYLVNDQSTTPYSNFNESFSRISTPRTRRLAKNGDSLYKFEGYRVFQLKNASVSVNNIFNERGEVDNTVAAEVFESDIQNGISGLVNNYVSAPELGAGVINTQQKVKLKDSGIVHSFQLSNDAFAKGADKRFVNYRNYYFVAVAFAVNNFRPFSFSLPDSTQNTPYLESAHTANGRNIPIVAAMPNPASGFTGSLLTSDYGDGVIIKRLEGAGNGGNATAFDAATEDEAIKGPNYQALQPVYQPGAGPVRVKVIDPAKVQPLDWELYITDTLASDTAANRFITGASPSVGWKLQSTDAAGNKIVIYNERGNTGISTPNEQIIEKYGLSVDIHQVGTAGDTLSAKNGLITSDITFNDPNNLWMAGVQDVDVQTDPRNWIRAGTLEAPKGNPPCNYADNNVSSTGRFNQDPYQYFESLLPGSTLNKGSWAPAVLAAVEGKSDCGFGVAEQRMLSSSLKVLKGVDVVFTSDKTKWTRCVVMELQDDVNLADGQAKKFLLRAHQSWNGQLDATGAPVYSKVEGDIGYSYFPGYAINPETGERLNIVLGEDSYLKSDNGSDLIWNPSGNVLSSQGAVLFGGKHYVYIMGTKYDQDSAFWSGLQINSPGGPLYNQIRWIGLPILAPGYHFKSLADGLIPTDTRVRIRVNVPYTRYIPELSKYEPRRNNGFPLYTFSTKGLAQKPLTDAGNYSDAKQELLDKILMSPNPYYGYVGYEASRLDTRVRIINLPKKATISIYSTDGSLIRTLTKDNDLPYVDWDTRNAKGLAISSGMYLVHVQAEGIGEKVIRWFGAMRPVDLTTY